MNEYSRNWPLIINPATALLETAEGKGWSCCAPVAATHITKYEIARRCFFIALFKLPRPVDSRRGAYPTLRGFRRVGDQCDEGATARLTAQTPVLTPCGRAISVSDHRPEAVPFQNTARPLAAGLI